MAVRKRTWKNKNGGKSFTWQFDYKDEFKKRKTKGGFRTKLEAEAEEAKIKNQVNEGRYMTQDKSYTFVKAADDFLNLHAKIYCKASTWKSYESLINKHLIPFFGSLKLVDVNMDLINKFILLKIQSNQLTNKTVNNFLKVLATIFQKAVDAEIIAKNPVSKVKKLKVYHQEMRFLETLEIKALLQKTKTEFPDFHPLLFTAIATGMRRGELLALTWDKINFKTRKIFVSQGMFKNEFISPKSPASVRRINMAEELYKTLKEWKIKCPIGEKNLVFPNSEGNFTDPDNMIKRRFEPSIRKTGLDKIRFHDLRHTFASILIAQNVPVKYIQSQMGHSSIQITMDRYGHLMPEVHQKGIEALDNLFDPTSDNLEKPVQNNSNNIIQFRQISEI